MSKVPSAKQRQLLVAVDWPVTQDLRSEAGLALQEMKHSFNSAKACLSWPYLAGFFDAEGCIRVLPVNSYLRLELGQNCRSTLEGVKEFLDAEVPNVHCNITKKTGSANVLTLSRQADCQFVLRRLMAAGMLVKRKQAEVALSLGESHRDCVRNALGNLVGNQSRYQRLDERGCLRTYEIMLAERRLRFLISSCKLDDVQRLRGHLHALRSRHELLCVETRYHTLRTDIRQLLK
ncbi:unnamed protein product [Polarella glacialis]|uniref:Uncharacterized protein n=1 Tax=Polarella glacialis TaxID=89957 RepID=A0A813IT74_POLGL|nr:unnamed protein product [Polarella glacialis]CAE8657438.1 unnamed protein product [Polarella glacialis]